MAKAKSIDKSELVLQLGAPVIIKTASYGWGGFHKEEEGIIVSRDKVDADVYNYRVVSCITGGIAVFSREDLVMNDKYMMSTEKGYIFSPSSKVYLEERAEVKLTCDYFKLLRTPKEIIRSKVEAVGSEINKIQKELDSKMVVQEYYKRLSTPGTLMPKNPSTYACVVNYCAYIFDYYSSVEIDNNSLGITGITKSINLWYNNKMCPMGAYKVVMDASGLHIFAERDNRVVEGFIHPHIDINGHPCLGTWRAKIEPYIIRLDYIYALMMIHEYISCYNEKGWYMPVNHWLPDADKRCRKCWEITGECKCRVDICVYCGQDISGCSCVRCPESEEIIGREYDEYCKKSCEKWDKKGNVCMSATVHDEDETEHSEDEDER